MDRLREIYARYFETAAKVRAKASPLAGVWGLGNDPRHDRCHDDFYDAVERWVEDFTGNCHVAREAVQFILEQALEHKQNKDVYWYLFAAQKLTLELIPRLDAADAAVMFDWYDRSFPKKGRLPAQEQVWKALKMAKM